MSPPVAALGGNGPAFSVISAMRWLGTSGMTNGGSTVSLRWLSLNGSVRVFRCPWASNEVHLLPEATIEFPLATPRWTTWAKSASGDLALDVGGLRLEMARL